MYLANTPTFPTCWSASAEHSVALLPVTEWLIGMSGAAIDTGREAHPAVVFPEKSGVSGP